MRFLVAGAAGFLGSHLTDRLLAEGHGVLGVDDLSSGRSENLTHLENEPRFDLVRHDVTRPLPTTGHLDGVLNLASPTSPLDYPDRPLETLEVGSRGTRNLLDLAHRHGARFLLASTPEVYGDPEVHPQAESSRGNMSPCGLRSVYGQAKRYAETLTVAYGRVRSVPVRIARIFNTYGPRMRPTGGRVVSNFIVQALEGRDLTVHGDGSQTRSFCYVEDQVEGLLRLFRSDVEGPMNIGSDEEHTVLSIARRVLEATGSSSRIVHRDSPRDDSKVRRPDLARALALLGWCPRVILDEGLRLTIRHFRHQLGIPAADEAGPGARPEPPDRTSDFWLPLHAPEQPRDGRPAGMPG